MKSLVDPEVSNAKFDREVESYRRNESIYIEQGWLLLKAEYPEVFVIQCATHLPPPFSALIGISIDFTDYDLVPPSVRLVHPFTRIPYPSVEEIPIKFYRHTSVPGVEKLEQIQDLLQAHPGSKPFLCLPGVREYHNHPAHSGDNWLLHRGQVEGSLHFILNQLYRYGVSRALNIAIEFRPLLQYRRELE